MWCFIVLQALQRVPLFAGLDPKTKGAIASALGQVSMPKGTAVVTQVRSDLFASGFKSCDVSPLLSDHHKGRELSQQQYYVDSGSAATHPQVSSLQEH